MIGTKLCDNAAVDSAADLLCEALSVLGRGGARYSIDATEEGKEYCSIHWSGGSLTLEQYGETWFLYDDATEETLAVTKTPEGTLLVYGQRLALQTISKLQVVSAEIVGKLIGAPVKIARKRSVTQNAVDALGVTLQIARGVLLTAAF